MHVDAVNASQKKARLRGRAFGALFTAALCLTGFGHAGAYPLSTVALDSNDEGGVLRLEATDGSGNLSHEVFCLDDPYRVVVDVFGADTPIELAGTPEGIVSRVRSSIWRDDENGRIVRYVLETNAPVDYATNTGEGSLEVHLVPSGSEVPGVMSNQSGLAQGEMLGEDSGWMLNSGGGSSDFRSAMAMGDDTHGDASLMASGHETTPMPTQENNSSGTTSMYGMGSGAHTTSTHDTGSDASTMSTNDTGSDMADAGTWQDDSPYMGNADPRGAVKSPDSGFGTTATGAGLMQTGGRAMNLDVQNADVRTVFRSISAFSGQNIVPDRDVSGPVSVQLKEVPWRQALDIVAKSAGLIAIEEDSGVIRVATTKTYNNEELERESSARKKEELMQLETHVFRVGYANSKELVDAVKVVLSERGSVIHDSRTNAVIVTDIAPRIADAGGLIRNLDAETEQVEIVARLVDMDVSAVRRLGVSWDALNLGDADEGFSMSGGVSEPLIDDSGQLRFGLVRSWGNLDATLQAFEQTNDANIISNPKITTVNNHAAEILVGKEIPLITLDEAGNPVTELKKVGITLRVTPYINSDGHITMDLHPEISDLSSQATVQGGLIFNTTEAQTRIMVKDGETAVIGGLIRTNETEFEQGVPILREIPFLGNLFKSTDKVTEKRELLIFVTPRKITTMASNG